MTREEALAEARRRKEEVFGELAEPRTQYVGQTVEQTTADGKAIGDLTAEVTRLRGLIELALGVEPADGKSQSSDLTVEPEPAKAPDVKSQAPAAIDVEKIKADREKYIAEEIRRESVTPTERACGDDGTKKVMCNSCGSDFTTFPGEADHCPKCCGTDLSYMRDDELTISQRISRGVYHAHTRFDAATKRLEHLRAKRTKFPAVLTIPEGWVDANPNSEEASWYSLGLGADDNYAYYTRCGEFEMQGFKTPDDGKNGLASHCEDCRERQEGCWKPEGAFAFEPMPEPESEHVPPPEIELEGDKANEDAELIPLDQGFIKYDRGSDGSYTYAWTPWCADVDHVTTPGYSYKDAKKDLVSHCKRCAERGFDVDDGMCRMMPDEQEPDGKPQEESSTENAAFSDDVRVPGVTWNKARRTWEVRAYVDGKRTYIESFADKKDAIAAKVAAEVEAEAEPIAALSR